MAAHVAVARLLPSLLPSPICELRPRAHVPTSQEHKQKAADLSAEATSCMQTAIAALTGLKLDAPSMAIVAEPL